jgi:hypothetical protein
LSKGSTETACALCSLDGSPGNLTGFWAGATAGAPAPRCTRAVGAVRGLARLDGDEQGLVEVPIEERRREGDGNFERGRPLLPRA